MAQFSNPKICMANDGIQSNADAPDHGFITGPEFGCVHWELKVMNFASALQALMDGKHVRRLCWPADTHVSKLTPGVLKLDDITDPYLRMFAQANGGTINVHDHYYLQYHNHGLRGGWFPNQDDMDAIDWTAQGGAGPFLRSDQ